MSTHGLLRRVLRRVRRLLLPEFDLILLERRRLARLVPAGAAVLDAGCGNGAIALRLARRGCRVLAVSNDPAAIVRLLERSASLSLPAEALKLRVHDLARDGPPGGDFDAAVCFDVLEHILDDRAALGALAASLRPGGQLLLTVPDRAAPPLWGDAVSPTEDGGHVRPGYTRAELEGLLDAAGLRPVRWKGFAGFFAQKATNVSRRLERLRGRLSLLLRFAWLTAMRPLCCLDRLLPYPTYELFVLAEKPPSA